MTHPRDCDRARLPAALADLFEPLPADPWIDAFVAAARPHGGLKAAAHAGLRRFVSDFDADGLLGTHPMALLGEASWEALVGRGARLLDVGAGSGDVTAQARVLFDEIVTTETSRPMARRLRRRGFECHRVDLARVRLDERPFDVVSLLNVLDRTDRPRTLLRAAVSQLAPGGRLLLSVPLPAAPHVDRGALTVDPDEPMAGYGETWEAALADLCADLLGELTLERLARAPYLTVGKEGLRALDAALVVAAP